MTQLYLQDPDVTLLHGDVLGVLRELPAESVDCVITSPPYWGLRDYGTGTWEGGNQDCDHTWHRDYGEKSDTNRGSIRGGPMRDVCGKCGARRVDNQIGLEPTPDAYIARMVDVFREVRRVLAKHGTCWVNMGDGYASGEIGRHDRSDGYDGEFSRASTQGQRKQTRLVTGLKPKDLVGMPWRLAFALQTDGWYLRADIIWAKPNPMPESVTDRPTKAHEYVFLLTKRPRYWFDQEAVREQFEAKPQLRLTALKDQPLAAARRAAGVEQGNPQGGTHANPWYRQDETLDVCGCLDAGCGRSFHEDDCGCACHSRNERGPDGRCKTTVQGGDGSLQHRDGERWPNSSGRNIRSVWDIATQPYPEAHFATYPEELVRRCLLAGCVAEVCRECGKPRERIVERIDSGERQKKGDGWATHDGGHGSFHRDGREQGEPEQPVMVAQTLGWSDCGCGNVSCVACKMVIPHALRGPGEAEGIPAELVSPARSRQEQEMAGEDVRALSKDVPRSEVSTDVLASMRSPVGSARGQTALVSEEDRRLRDESGLQVSLHARASDGDGGREEVGARASRRDGSPPRPDAIADGVGASQERNQERQPDRKLRARDARDPSGTSDLSSLPAHIQCEVDACPSCGGPLRYQTPNYRPGVVLDPFVGSGTTALVARNHGRHAIGIDLRADYLELAARRLQQLSLLAETR